MDPFMSLLFPEIAVEFFSVDIGPVEDLLLVIPQRSFAAQISIIGRDVDDFLLERLFCLR
jgi:hypothetical protein